MAIAPERRNDMTEIFDQVKSLADTKIDAFEISNENGKDAAARATAQPTEIIAPHFDDSAFNAQLDNAYRSHIEANLPKPEVIDPTMRETLKAAFQSGNMIGSALSSQTLTEQFFTTKDSPEQTDDQILDFVAARDLTPYLPRFQGVTNLAQLTARANDIEREIQNQNILAGAGLSGTVAQLAAGIIDLSSLIPVGEALRIGRAGAGLLTRVGEGAAAGAGYTALSEAGLQASQQTRTGDESVMNIASGAILGGAVGGLVHVMVGADVAAKVDASMDAYRKDASLNFPEARANVDALDAGIAKANGVEPVEGDVSAAAVEAVSPSPSSVGAAAVDWEQLKAEARAHGELADAKVSAGLFDKVPSITTVPTEWMGKFLGGKTLLGQPRQAFRTSPLDNVRQFGRMFYASPEISEANVKGLADTRRATVEDLYDKDRTMLGRFKAAVSNIFAAAEKGRFKSKEDLAQKAYYAVLDEGIDHVSNDPAIEAVAREFRKYSDYQLALHVKNGKLPEDLDTVGADGYVRRVYNVTALRNEQARALSMLEKWATRKVTADVEEELAHTQYTERLKAHDDSVASYEKRVEFWQKHPGRLKYWENRRDIALAQDKADFETANANWRNRVSEWGSDPANDGKDHPFSLQKPKVSQYEMNSKSFDQEFGPRPRKGDKPLVTEGNPKPAVPKGKYGVPMLREHIPAYSKALAQDVYDTLAGVKSTIPNTATSRVRVKTGYLRSRVVDIPDSALANEFFLSTDLLDHAELMHKTSGRQAAFGSVFKTVDGYGNEIGDYTGNSILVDIEKEAKAKIDAAAGDEKTRLIDERDKHMAGVRNEVDQFVGNFDPGKGFGLLGPKAAHTLASLAYAVRLGGVTVSSLTDAPKIAIAHGLGDTFRYGVMPMFKDFRNAVRKGGVMREQGMRMGTVAEAVHATRLRDAFELNNPHQTGDPWLDFVDKTTRTATLLSGINYWTDFMKILVHNVTSSRILRLAEIGHERLSEKNVAWLANIGIEESDLRKIGEEYRRQDTRHVAGVLFADIDRWTDQDLAARFETAMRRENRNTIVSPGFGDRPQFAYDATGKLFLQFQSFMLIDQTRFVARQVQLANVGGDAAEKMRQRVALGAGLSSLVLGAVFVDSLKRALRDSDADWNAFVDRWEKNSGGSLYDALDRSGIAGSLFTASNTFSKLPFGQQFSLRSGMQWLAGDATRSDPRKVQDIGLGGVLLGPGAGLVEDAVHSGRTLSKVVSGGEISRGDLQRFQHVLPFNSAPGIQQALSAVKELSATALGVPPEQTPH
jgi:hypothetical protein